MLVQFETLPGSARIWIYQSSRFLTDKEQSELAVALNDFLQTWTAHQANLKSGFKIMHNLFVIIGVDENYNNASGCSIDKQVNFMKQQGTKFGIDFFNRLLVARMVGENIETGNLHEFTEAIQQGKVDDQVMVFNNLVASADEFRKDWLQPVRKSWIKSLITA